MRPYLAVVKDSLREALASRVLWILLVLVSAVLLGLAPFGYRQPLLGRIERHDVDDWFALLGDLRQGAARADTPTGRLWRALDTDVRQAVEQFPRERGQLRQEDSRRLHRVIEGLNAALASPDLYAADVWRAESLSGEAKTLLAESQAAPLDAERQRRFNRLLVEAAFPRSLGRSFSHSVVFTWGPFDFSPELPLTRGQLERIVQATVASFANLLVGVMGVFVGVLATAYIIPQMFDAGAINLLLSKPVSRSALLLAKFVGGCSFIFVAATFLVVGLWLVAGVRFNVWNVRLLWCIPLFMFIFATYYSVSALAGLVWRNTIVAIAAAVLFWFACFTVGTTKATMEEIVINPARLVQLTAAGDTLVAHNERGEAFYWSDGQWRPTLVVKGDAAARNVQAMFNPTQRLGPQYDASRQRLVSLESVGGFRAAGLGGWRLVIGEANADAGGFLRTDGAATPETPIALGAGPRGEVLLVTRGGVFEVAGDGQAGRPPLTLFGVALPLTGGSGPFDPRPVDRPLALSPPAAAAIDSRDGRIAVYSRGELALLAPDDDGRYVRGESRPLSNDENLAVSLALAGDTLLVARGDGRVMLLDAATLATRHDLTPESGGTPRFVAAAPHGGQFSVLSQAGRLWLIEPATGRLRQAPVAGQGEISAAQFAADGSLWVVDRATRASRYQGDDFRLAERRAPPPSLFERVYWLAIAPAYRIFPKPGELQGTVQYVLTGKTDAGDLDNQSLDARRPTINPWQPVWSTGLFLAIVLVVSCLYFERQEY